MGFSWIFERKEVIPMQADESKKGSWQTKDGQIVEPDSEGVWPATSTDERGQTIVSGPGGKTDQV
jgi:hypothetical protein